MKTTSRLTRREFVAASSKTLALGAALASGPALNVLGANDKIRLGFIGVGGRGFDHFKQFQAMSDVELVAAADASQPKLERAKAAASQIRTYKDYRQLLESKDIDAVVIATPDHWHAIQTIHACQAGKDVYVEKPLGHNIREGRAMVRAARKYDRVVQLGTQQRSGPTWIEAVERIKSGEFGKISLVRTWNCWGLESIHADMGNPPDSDPPPGVDYDLWLGPAPSRRFNPRHFDFYFYYHWAYSGGMLSAWGVHLFDVVTWAMGPTINAVTTVGGKFVFSDARETPDTAAVTFECPGYVWTYELRHGNGKDPWGEMDHGIEFYGTKASLRINRRGYTVFLEDARSEPLKVQDRGQDTQHKRNWLECIRSRKRPNADVELGHLGSIPGHLGNIAYRVGRRIVWDGQNETIPNDPDATALLGRTYRAPYLLPEV
ncbi:MAG TPA: Gfo/Idh/MocA family oxidoreductase [Verrucomicrobiota bacterium]|nr:Gfo/Idh/MocA family oxidoreductase [Verrucomicrobiota bacterium]HOK77560.1 Gfo/Idh/MocA family oxidoreductase [Verrucomicrobiota bacterium]